MHMEEMLYHFTETTAFRPFEGQNNGLFPFLV